MLVSVEVIIDLGAVAGMCAILTSMISTVANITSMR